MKSKPELRLIAKDIRKNLDICKVSEKIVQNVRNHVFYKQAKNVMLFYPTKYEVNLLSLLKDDKNFYLPRVSGENLLVCRYNVGDVLVKSDFNIMEPDTAEESVEVLDLVIVPALMADKNGFRLGYGGGYYDRFLTKYRNIFKTIAVIPKDLYQESLPTDEFDVPVDFVISD